MKTKNKTPNKKNNLIETILVVIAIIVIPLFFSMNTGANSQAEQNTNESLLPTVVANIPPINEEAKPKQPPACTFPLAQTSYEETTPEEYIFSEPERVQADLSNIYEIIEWLPDNERVLITQTYQSENYQSIDILNPKTGEIEVYATRPTILGKPAWLSELNAVIYPVTNLVISNPNSPKAFQPPYHQIRQLWVSQGNPNEAQLLENTEMTLDFLSVFSISASPNGKEVIYLSNTDKQLFKIKVSKTSLDKIQSVPFNPSEVAYLNESSNSQVSYNMLWRPNSTQIFLYTSVSHSSQEHYSFILDIENSDICKLILSDEKPPSVDLIPRWSPNGQYLAFINIGGITVVDMHTGNLYEMNQEELLQIDIKGEIGINDIAWAPDNRHIAIAVSVYDYSVPPSEDYIKLRNLYLIDFIANQSKQITSNINLGTYYGYTSLLWSDNGEYLLVMCSTQEGLCLLPVTQNIKQ